MKLSNFKFPSLFAIFGTVLGILFTKIWTPDIRTKTKSNIKTVAGTLLIAAFGVFLGQIVTSWNEKTHQNEEFNRGIRRLKSEIQTNIIILEETKVYLNRDSELANEGKHKINPLVPLPTRSWEGLYLAGTLSDRQPSLHSELEETYVLVMVINEQIKARELYRLLNESMNNYHQRRKIINELLLKDIEKVLQRFKEHQKTIQ